jgi:putative drug exporter of the RND superfamily
MSKLLFRIGHGAARHPVRTLGLWAVIIALVLAAQGRWGGEVEDSFTIPGAESQQAHDLLEDRFPAESHNSGEVVFHVDDTTFDDPAATAPIAEAVTALGDVPHVVDVSNPFDPRGPTVSADGRTAYATVTYDGDAATTEMVDGIADAVAPARAAGVQAETTSPLTVDETGPGGSEMIGLLVAVVVLLAAFGSVIAMGVPIATALIGIFIGSAGVTLLAGVMDVPGVSPMLAVMIGLGVGIDYALFIVTRHRQNLHAGMSVPDAAGWANATAGQAVVFAGTTVVVAICGLQLSGLPAVAAMGFACAVVVLVAVLVAVTLLPALLGIAGHGIDRLRVPGRRHGDAEGDAVTSRRWAHHVGGHPWRYAALSLVVLGLLAVPVAGLRMGFADDSNGAAETTEKRSYDLMAEGFGAGFNGPLQIVVDGGPGGAEATAAALPAVQALVAEEAGVASVLPPVLNEDGDVALVLAHPATSPQDERTEDLVKALRDDLPGTVAGTDAEVLVGGGTAAMIDVSGRIADRLPVFIAAVVGLSFLLLMVMFRSILVPLKAALMNLLSIGAAYGIVVAVFQWGWGKDLVGIDATMPINPFVPLIMFAILFGLSMDYEVFLLSRVREEYLRTGDSHRSVVDGLGATARVITSAALIMISVFGAFVFGDDPVMKMFGLGLATAVLIDATVVRMVLVPATMSLLGRANWWLPGWLDRLLPTLDLEGGAPALDGTAGADDEEEVAPERIAA